MRVPALAPLAAALLLAACSGPLKSDYQISHERAANYLAQNPGLDPDTKAAIASFELRKGMTMDQVVAAWGPPAVVQRFREGAVQYWFFGCNWRHICTTADEMFPPPDAIYQSRALFQDGTLVDFSG